MAKLNSIFIKLEITTDIGRTILGKYTFFTRSLFDIIADALDCTDVEKKIQGSKATNINM
jgi:hypothetical protein